MKRSIDEERQILQKTSVDAKWCECCKVRTREQSSCATREQGKHVQRQDAQTTAEKKIPECVRSPRCLQQDARDQKPRQREKEFNADPPGLCQAAHKVRNESSYMESTAIVEQKDEKHRDAT